MRSFAPYPSSSKRAWQWANWSTSAQYSMSPAFRRTRYSDQSPQQVYHEAYAFEQQLDAWQSSAPYSEAQDSSISPYHPGNVGRGVARTGLGVLGRGVGAGVGAIGDGVGAYVGHGIRAYDGDCERVGGTDAVSAK